MISGNEKNICQMSTDRDLYAENEACDKLFVLGKRRAR